MTAGFRMKGEGICRDCTLAMTPTRAVALVVAAVVTVAGITVWLWADGPSGEGAE